MNKCVTAVSIARRLVYVLCKVSGLKKLNNKYCWYLYNLNVVNNAYKKFTVMLNILKLLG